MSEQTKGVKFASLSGLDPKKLVESWKDCKTYIQHIVDYDHAKHCNRGSEPRCVALCVYGRSVLANADEVRL